MSTTAVLFLFFPGVLARAFTDEARVLAVAVTLIPLAGVFQVFDGLQVVSSGVLRGVGDTRAPMVVNLLGFWFLGMPVSLWMGFRAGLGPAGLWWGLVVGLAAVAVILLYRIQVRFGRDLKRIVIDEEE
jgi:MATE family multidrug resistance protein